jgi:hypothetical protein
MTTARPPEPDRSGAPGRPAAAGLWVALVVYGLGLACLAAMAVLQASGPR